MVDLEGGHDEPRWLMCLVAAGLAVIAAGLLVLWVDLRHTAAVEIGRSPAPHVVVHTPATYGPPPDRRE